MNISARDGEIRRQDAPEESALLRSEKGMVLIVTMVMLVMLTMLGVYALSTSTTELHIAGNYRNEQIAFYNCNEAEAYGPNHQAILTHIVPNVVNSFPSGTTFQPVVMPSGATGQTQYRVEYICTSQAPPGLGYTSSDTAAYHSLVTIVGKGANASSECVVEHEVIRLLPMDANQLLSLLDC